MRTRDIILPAVAGLLCLAILGHLMGHPPDPANWPRCEYFRCVTCDGPASIDPDQPERWGCRACRFATWGVADRFRPGTLADFGSFDALEWACIDAGGLSDSEVTQRTPAAIFSEAGGVRGD